MALTKCRECEGQVSTEAAACPHCGAPQREVPPPLPPHAQPPPLEFETCEIEIVAVKTSGLFTQGEAKLSANVSGPKGSYTAQESPTFTAFIDRDGSIKISDSTFSKANQALDALTSSLEAEGWEFVGLHGESFWNMQFRRAVQ